MTKKRVLFFLLLMIVIPLSTVKAQHFLEKSFLLVFPNGVAKQVAYINIPKGVPFAGNFEVEVTGTFGSQISRGLLSKRTDIIYNGTFGSYFNQSSVVTEASEPLAAQWNIGDFDPETSQIPIYHLASTSNQIGVKIRFHIIQEASVPRLQNGLTVTDPIVVDNSVTRPFKYFNESRIGIGTNSPEHKLDIVGTARAHEIIVNTQKTADFVFEPDYKNPSLEQIDAFINTNKHLPGIQSAAQMEKEGLNVGQFQIDLLQKIEELTLHLIEKNKEMKDLKENMKVMQQEIDSLKNNKKSLYR